MPRLKPRMLDRLIVALVILAMVQLALRWRADNGIESAFSDDPIPIGERLDAVVVDDLTGEFRSLSDVEAGKCRYVIIASRTCPYSRALATRWTITALNDPTGASMPDGWATFWVAAESPSGAGELFDSAFPVATHHSVQDREVIHEAGAFGVPFHVVLDSAGVVVSGGLGGELLPMSAFGPGCTVDLGAAVPEYTPSSELARQ